MDLFFLLTRIRAILGLRFHLKGRWGVASHEQDQQGQQKGRRHEHERRRRHDQMIAKSEEKDI